MNYPAAVYIELGRVRDRIVRDVAKFTAKSATVEDLREYASGYCATIANDCIDPAMKAVIKRIAHLKFKHAEELV